MKNYRIKYYLKDGGFLHAAKIILSLAFMLAIFDMMLLPQIKANYYYKETTCLITAKQLMPLATKVRTTDFIPKFLAVYSVDKKIYAQWAYDSLNTIYAEADANQILARDFQSGQYYVCWYATDDPHQLVLKRGWDRTSLLFFMMTCVVALLSLINAYRWLRAKNARERVDSG